MIELSVQEFTMLVNLAAKAPVTAGDTPTLGPIFNKAVAMVNAGLPIRSGIDPGKAIPVALADVVPAA